MMPEVLNKKSTVHVSGRVQHLRSVEPKRQGTHKESLQVLQGWWWPSLSVEGPHWAPRVPCWCGTCPLITNKEGWDKDGANTALEGYFTGCLACLSCGFSGFFPLIPWSPAAVWEAHPLPVSTGIPHAYCFMPWLLYFWTSPLHLAWEDSRGLRRSLDPWHPYGKLGAAFWHRISSALAIAIIWATSQWMEDLGYLLFFENLPVKWM